MTVSSMNICSVALTLLLKIIFGFLTLKSIINDSKEIVNLGVLIFHASYV